MSEAEIWRLVRLAYGIPTTPDAVKRAEKWMEENPDSVAELPESLSLENMLRRIANPALRRLLMKRILLAALLILGFLGSNSQAQQPRATGLCPAARAVVSDGLHSLGAQAPPHVVGGGYWPPQPWSPTWPPKSAQPVAPTNPAPIVSAPPQVVVGSSQAVPMAMPCTSVAKAHPIRDAFASVWANRPRLRGGCQ